MRLIIDLIPNHTSLQHEWFKESSNSANNAKNDFYIWKKTKKEWVSYCITKAYLNNGYKHKYNHI